MAFIKLFKNKFKHLLISGLIAGFIIPGLGISYILFPLTDSLPQSDQLRSQTDQISITKLSTKPYYADYMALNAHFEGQIYRSYCGVASSVAVLKALGHDVSQKTFFDNGKTNDLRSFYKVFFTGMSLADLDGLLRSYGVSTRLHYASDININEFRGILKNNMKNPKNYMLVNYLRASLGQGGIGHISPIGAYDELTDEVLIMDVTTYNYPSVWVKLTLLFNAMNTPDAEYTRGFVEIF